MNRELWPLYEQELTFIRTEAEGFAAGHGPEADALRLGPGGHSTDPHVERLLQGFALLAARVRQKVDDDFPELTDGLLELMYPHYLAPLPSLMVVQLEPPVAAPENVRTVPRHTRFRTDRVALPGGGEVECEYRSVYPVRLWPLAVTEATAGRSPFADLDEVPAAAAARPRPYEPAADRGELTKGRIKLRIAAAAGVQRLADLPLDRLRLFIDSKSAVDTAELYELLLNHARAVVFRRPGGTRAVAAGPGVRPADNDIRPDGYETELPLSPLTPVGFGVAPPDAADDDPRNEGVLPYPPHAFPGYRLLTEFFAYRDKFWFVDLGRWDWARAAGVLDGTEVEVHILLDTEVRADLAQAINTDTFRPGCTPLVNLFRRPSEGVQLTETRYQYELPFGSDARDAYEVYSVDAVTRLDRAAGAQAEFHPFYSFRHQDADRDRRYWFARRRPDPRPGDRGTRVEIGFVDRDFNPRAPLDAVAVAEVTLLNRDLPDLLRRFDQGRWAVWADGRLPATVVRNPTPTRRPARRAAGSQPRAGGYWRLLSHFALNHLGLNGPGGRDALAEYLALYDPSVEPDDRGRPSGVDVGGARRVRDGLTAVASRPDVAFVSAPGGQDGGFARGLHIDLVLDEEKFRGVGLYLFAAVMERFLAAAASVNSFTRLSAWTARAWDERTNNRPVAKRAGAEPARPFKEWSPRSGDRPLL